MNLEVWPLVKIINLGDEMISPLNSLVWMPRTAFWEGVKILTPPSPPPAFL